METPTIGVLKQEEENSLLAKLTTRITNNNNTHNHNHKHSHNHNHNDHHHYNHNHNRNNNAHRVGYGMVRWVSLFTFF